MSRRREYQMETTGRPESPGSEKLCVLRPPEGFAPYFLAAAVSPVTPTMNKSPVVIEP
jgi:hypothetical protein